jgi:hypothetical protein
LLVVVVMMMVMMVVMVMMMMMMATLYSLMHSHRSVLAAVAWGWRAGFWVCLHLLHPVCRVSLFAQLVTIIQISPSRDCGLKCGVVGVLCRVWRVICRCAA